MIPEGKHGTAEIRHDTPSDFDRLRGALKGMPLHRSKYVRLLIDGEVMMTDAEFEQDSNEMFSLKARGHCLIAGLGIGLILTKNVRERCHSITVVEKDPDVIALVAPYFPDVIVVQSDIKDYKPTRKFDTIYFDIWPVAGGDQEDEAKILRKKFKPYLTKGGWIGDWATQAMALL